MIEYGTNQPKVLTGRSTHGPGLREKPSGARLPKGRAEGAREPWGGNAPPVPAVTGFESGAPRRFEFRWKHGLCSP